MKILVTGAAGFVGSTLISTLLDSESGLEITGLDNLVRSGSETNRRALQKKGVRFIHGDVRLASDFENLSAVDWVIDAAANPSVLAGIDGKTSSRQVIEHNLGGTVNMLEYCRRTGAGFILLSTSRVYSIKPLANLPVITSAGAFAPDRTSLPPGLSASGIDETFSTEPPLSLYGSSKLASETLALEYGEAFNFPVWINRCGVLAGAGQFGRPDQGIFSFWIHSWLRDAPLKYIGFEGTGHQVRDCLHPRDLLPLLRAQMQAPAVGHHRIQNVSGGASNSMSLLQLSNWCSERFRPRVDIGSSKEPRPFDLPWVILDSSRANSQWNWQPSTPIQTVLEEIAGHAEDNPDWLDLSRDTV